MPRPHIIINNTLTAIAIEGMKLSKQLKYTKHSYAFIKTFYDTDKMFL